MHPEERPLGSYPLTRRDHSIHQVVQECKENSQALENGPVGATEECWVDNSLVWKDKTPLKPGLYVPLKIHSEAIHTFMMAMKLFTHEWKRDFK